MSVAPQASRLPADAVLDEIEDRLVRRYRRVPEAVRVLEAIANGKRHRSCARREFDGMAKRDVWAMLISEAVDLDDEALRGELRRRGLDEWAAYWKLSKRLVARLLDERIAIADRRERARFRAVRRSRWLPAPACRPPSRTATPRQTARPLAPVRARARAPRTRRTRSSSARSPGRLSADDDDPEPEPLVAPARVAA
jgi:hypothetical protein